MPPSMRSHQQHTAADIMSLITPAIFFIAAFSGSYLFAHKTRHSRHTRTRDLAASVRDLDYDSEDENDENDAPALDATQELKRQDLVFDSGDDGESLVMLDRPQFRTQFGVRSGAAVRGYPSYGGVYVLHCTAVELDFLGLDRFHIAMRSINQDEEDVHCNNMRRLGATWWDSEATYRRWAMNPNKTGSPVTFVGWPAGGGVWVLRTTYDEASARGMGRINNCYTMDERCRLIKELGGEYYQNPREGLYLEF
ncbi:hypothetical protein M426DRAFT_322995 [Hypoxylon sp. CI-4A]|nr:hypothetical protein M426DRAFT_322995 [Hypoxylon sp. CI-4A]